LGGDYPVRIQSMATVSTMDTEGAVSQAIRMIEAGAEYVRFTAQGEREARNLQNIRNLLTAKGYTTPLVADIHFNPAAACEAALHVEKVRINPGNFAEGAESNRHCEERSNLVIKSRFVPFLDICRRHNTAIRIGVNHGSLSERILAQYGDTPEGMVASCMEYLRICMEEKFYNVAISVKASNTVVMIRTVRLLVKTMDSEGMHFPLHLGVTEAGEGEDGRIKSAVGIGTLLADGIGDTVRVSLSEEPENELPVARLLVDYICGRALPDMSRHCEEVAERNRHCEERSNLISTNLNKVQNLLKVQHQTGRPQNLTGLQDLLGLKPRPQDLSSLCQLVKINDTIDSELNYYPLTYHALTDSMLQTLRADPKAAVVLSSAHPNPVAEMRGFMRRLRQADCQVPVILRRDYDETDLTALQIKAAADFGALLIDGYGDGIMLCNHNDSIDKQTITETMNSILQAARVKIFKNDYISCPGCGRTLFDLQKTVRQVKAATAHLKGLKIAVMGCIVNGPGEMADADYGYVGAGKGKISLYKGKTCVAKNIPESEAVERLLDLISGQQ